VESFDKLAVEKLLLAKCKAFLKAIPSKIEDDFVDKEEDELKDQVERFKLERLTMVDIATKIRNFAKETAAKLKRSTQDQIANIYKDQLQRASKELNIEFFVNDSDRMIVESVLNSSIVTNAFQNLEDIMVKKAVAAVPQLLMDATFEEVIRDITPEFESAEDKMRVIIRTESQNIVNLANEQALKRARATEENLIWTGPRDSRTTEYCQRITARASEGVTLQKLKQIIAEEADPNTYTPSRPFTPHINCRHSFELLRKP
jgi:hypothetical protein